MHAVATLPLNTLWGEKSARRATRGGTSGNDLPRLLYLWEDHAGRGRVSTTGRVHFRQYLHRQPGLHYVSEHIAACDDE